MYSIRWSSNLLVVGTKDSIFSLVNLLESNKIKFKVADCAGFIIQPKHFGYGDFEYWLKKDETF